MIEYSPAARAPPQARLQVPCRGPRPQRARRLARPSWPSSPRDHALCSLPALNGLRISEALGADIDQLRLERNHRSGRSGSRCHSLAARIDLAGSRRKGSRHRRSQPGSSPRTRRSKGTSRTRTEGRRWDRRCTCRCSRGTRRARGGGTAPPDGDVSRVPKRERSERSPSAARRNASCF